MSHTIKIESPSLELVLKKTSDETSPMIESASAFLKVHVQEARNTTPTKSEDLVYSETSSASGLISKFSKSMSYQ